ncbi:MAG: hypothetical protein FWE23_11275 [Chitinivibrionia bacterium]|nr:hypothetical protein [Chitinivibrionia bacterium]
MKAILCVFIFCFLPASIFGQTAEFERQHTFRAGDADSRVSARSTATQEAQALLLRELGVLVESRQRLSATNETEDFTEEVQIYTLGKVNTEVLQERWDGEIFSATFRMVVDTADLFRHLNNILAQRQQARADSIALIRRAQADSIALVHRARADSIAMEHQIRAQRAGLSTASNSVINRMEVLRNFVFSIRPEFVAGNSAMGAGGVIELGVIGRNGFYFSPQLSGGGIYFGGLLNFGACFNKDGFVKNVLGVSAGYHNTLLFVNFRQENEIVRYETGINVGVAGLFWKFMLGRDKNFDITNRILFGWQRNPDFYYMENDRIVFDEGLNATWTLGVGYTLTRKRR